MCVGYHWRTILRHIDTFTHSCFFFSLHPSLSLFFSRAIWKPVIASTMHRAVLPGWLRSEGTSVRLVRLRPETFDWSCHGLGHGDRFELYSSTPTFSLRLKKTHTKGDLHKELSCCAPMIYQSQICFEMQTNCRRILNLYS